MQVAEGEAIGYFVRAAQRVPVDVGGLKPDRMATEPAVEASNGRGVVVGEQHRLAKVAGAPSSLQALRRRTWSCRQKPQTYRLADGRNSSVEIGFKQLPRDFVDQRRVGLQCGFHVGAQGAVRVAVSQLAMHGSGIFSIEPPPRAVEMENGIAARWRSPAGGPNSPISKLTLGSASR